MRNLDRKVTMRCPLCGNDQFESLDETFEDAVYSPNDIRFRCSDCGSIYTKQELIDSNAEAIEIAADEMKQEAVKEFEKDLKKALKKWKF